MKPPCYFAISNRLEGYSEFGSEIDLQDGITQALRMAHYIFDDELEGEHARELWRQFVAENPSDKAGQFIARNFLTPPAKNTTVGL